MSCRKAHFRKQYLKRYNKAYIAPKKASQQIFMSVDWEALKMDAK